MVENKDIFQMASRLHLSTIVIQQWSSVKFLDTLERLGYDLMDVQRRKGTE